jgi:hypothetical protein
MVAQTPPSRLSGFCRKAAHRTPGPVPILEKLWAAAVIVRFAKTYNDPISIPKNGMEGSSSNQGADGPGCFSHPTGGIGECYVYTVKTSRPIFCQLERLPPLGRCILSV